MGNYPEDYGTLNLVSCKIFCIFKRYSQNVKLIKEALKSYENYNYCNIHCPRRNDTGPIR